MDYILFTFTCKFVEPGKPDLLHESQTYCSNVKDMRNKLNTWDKTSGPRNSTYFYYETPEQTEQNNKNKRVKIENIPPFSFIHTGSSNGMGFLAKTMQKPNYYF
jgi:hypothetical protein